MTGKSLPLYSTAHINGAKNLFKNLVHDKTWLMKQWNDDEINECIKEELADFVKNPSIANHPFSISIPNEELSTHVDLLLIDDSLSSNAEIKSVLSVGCGTGYKEIWLAKKYPYINFTCIDNAPYTKSLNKLSESLQLLNLRFKQHN